MPDATRRRARRRALTAAAALALGAVALGCGDGVTPVVYVLPPGYRGPVVIIFDDPRGRPPEYEQRPYAATARVYRIPAGGVLRTRFGPVHGSYEPSVVYEDAAGVRTPVWFTGACTPRRVPPDPRAADTLRACPACCAYASGPDGRIDFANPAYDALVVGSPAEGARFGREVDSLVGVLLSRDTAARPAAPPRPSTTR